MSHNPYGLGAEVSIDDATEWRLEQRRKGIRWPHRIEEYWSVKDKNLSLDLPALERRIIDAYGDPEGFLALEPRWFATDDQALFMEMYRHLKMDFVADFRTGLFFMDVFAGHEVIMGQLFDLTGKPCPKSCGGDSAEAYVITGLGMFKSSQSPIVWIGPDVAIPDYFRGFKHNVQVME